MLRKEFKKFVLRENIFKGNIEQEKIILSSCINMYNFICILVVKRMPYFSRVRFSEERRRRDGKGGVLNYSES